MSNPFSRPTKGLVICPLCVTWTCEDCDHTIHGRSRLHGFRCPKCGSFKATEAPVSHYNRDTHDKHVAIMKASSEPAVMTEELRDVMALADLLEPHMRKFRIVVRRTQYQEPDSEAMVASVKIGIRELRKIESTVRSWVSDHPEQKVF